MIVLLLLLVTVGGGADVGPEAALYRLPVDEALRSSPTGADCLWLGMVGGYSSG